MSDEQSTSDAPLQNDYETAQSFAVYAAACRPDLSLLATILGHAVSPDAGPATRGWLLDAANNLCRRPRATDFQPETADRLQACLDAVYTHLRMDPTDAGKRDAAGSLEQGLKHITDMNRLASRRNQPAARDGISAAEGQPTEDRSPLKMKVDLLRRASQIAATAHPLSMTFRAAAQVMEIKLDPQFTRYLERPEQTEVVRQMIADLRRLIAADPENAGPWVTALRALRDAEVKMADPTKWQVQTHHKEMAAKALGCQLRDVRDVRIDADGHLVARLMGGDFTTVTTFDLATA